MSAPRVLIVDDEPDFLRFLEDVLRKGGFVVSSAEDARGALRQAAESHPDVVLLDWNLPDKEGIEVCRLLKNDPETQDIAVIMLTARGRETDVVVGLETGADDYIAKGALRPRELTARVHAAARRNARRALLPAVLAAGVLRLDTARRQVSVGGEPVDLRAKEFELLCLFLTKKGHVLTRDLIAEAVWETAYLDSSRAIDTTVARLRQKLGKVGERIQAVKNVGYRFDDR